MGALAVSYRNQGDDVSMRGVYTLNMLIRGVCWMLLSFDISSLFAKMSDRTRSAEFFPAI